MPFLENSAGDRLEAHKKVEKGSQNSSDGKQNPHHIQLQQQWMIYQPVYNLFNLYKKLNTDLIVPGTVQIAEQSPVVVHHTVKNFKVSHVLH